MTRMSKMAFSRIYSSLFDFLSDAENELIILCPFIKRSALKKVLEQLSDSIKLTVVVRWKIEDLVFGSSDLGIYPLIKKLNHKLCINSDIHLKVLVKDKKEILLGSANMTGSGLGLVENPNIEAISVDNIDEASLHEIFKILKSSVTVDDNLFADVSDTVSKYGDIKKSIEAEKRKMRKQDERNMGKKKVNVVVADFPFCDSPKTFIDNYLNSRYALSELKHDMRLFNVSKGEAEGDLEVKLSSSFLASDAYAWQNEVVKDEASFGKYSSLLHDALLDDPKPFRKRVKELVSNMFNWTQHYSEEYGVRKVKHTHILYRK